MAKLIIEGGLLQLLKIQKGQRSLVARHIVTCSLQENKDQEDESSPESETLLSIDEQIDEENTSDQSVDNEEQDEQENNDEVIEDESNVIEPVSTLPFEMTSKKQKDIVLNKDPKVRKKRTVKVKK